MLSAEQLTPVLAQAVALDPSSFIAWGPLGAAVGGLLWYIGKLQDKIDRMVEAHKTEIAAERALNAKLQDDRLNDHKVLIPLANSMTAALDLQREQGK